MLLAFVAGRRTPTNVALAAAAPSWVDARILTPERAAALLGRSDAAVGRLDIADALDGVEDGLWALGTLAAKGVRVLNRAGALLAVHDKLLTARVLGREGLPHPADEDAARRRACAALDRPRRREAALRQLGARRDPVRQRGRLPPPPARARAQALVPAARRPRPGAGRAGRRTTSGSSSPAASLSARSRGSPPRASGARTSASAGRACASTRLPARSRWPCGRPPPPAPSWSASICFPTAPAAGRCSS